MFATATVAIRRRLTPYHEPGSQDRVALGIEVRNVLAVGGFAVLLATGDAVARHAWRVHVVVDQNVVLLFERLFRDRRTALGALRAVPGDDVLASVRDLRRRRDAKRGLTECTDVGVFDASCRPIGTIRIARVCGDG